MQSVAKGGHVIMLLRISLFVVVWFLPASDGACSCMIDQWPTAEQRFTASSSVFVARVVRVEEGPSDPPLSVAPDQLLNVDIRLIEKLKGDPPADNRVLAMVWNPFACGMPVFVGMDYVFFLAGSSKLISPLGPIILGPTEARAKDLEKLRRLRDSAN